ncbi:MAG: hypothetical protein M3P29_13035, partial [Acidobacteriota bacterium]|nr:hypothetical protein [Acidobacteriota bacterium]
MIRLAVTLVISLLSTTLFAGDIYIVQGSAEGPMFNDSERTIWTTDAVFYNTGSTNAVVTLLDVSNGGLRDPSRVPTSFTIPSHRTATLEGERTGWFPAVFDPLWAVHVDVPAGVLVESILFIGSRNEGGTNISPRDRPTRFGKVRLPIFRALTPAGEPQRHLATFLGAEPDIPSRINVGVYNGGAVAATAQIEIRRECDDTIVSSATVSVPAKTVIQVNNFNTNPGRGCPPASPGP